MEALAVQVTRVGEDGVAVGVAMHHVVGDGRAYWSFVKAWAEICRTGGLEARAWQLVDRDVVRDSLELSKFFFESLTSQATKRSPPPPPDTPPAMRKTFVLSRPCIQQLKQTAVANFQKTHHPLDWVSSFEAVCAHAWVCATRAWRVPARTSTVFNFTVDCRSLLHPALPETYFGNALKPCFVEAEACELLRDDGFARACAALHGRVRGAMEGNPISDWRLGDASLVGVHVVSSPKFRSYDVDFGWGRPRWIEFVPLVPNAAGTMVVAEARDDEGGFQVTMVLAQAHMDEFSVLFMGGA
ncbi:hypothetical protein QJS10_CPA09g00430 [Acorus calamus]|uniref:Uncharacterized protein n=1 Tax=Acorus calamus TaxID=4465 RepID=A0AAV9E7U8_ACOCL|nr:hypothetical protein QJS10_CPA09g00430 [Acorus calamus]